MMDRRKLLIASPALMATAVLPSPAIALPSFETHLAGMLEALSAMPWSENSRWFLSACGRAGSGRLLELSRYDTILDPEIANLKIERRTVLLGVEA